MKKIEAIIQPNKLPELKSALAHLGINGMTVSNVKGFGRGRGSHVVYGNNASAEFVLKVKVETVVKDQHVDPAIDIILEVCWTGRVGDGKIFITNVEEAIRIRTKESGEDAVKAEEGGGTQNEN